MESSWPPTAALSCSAQAAEHYAILMALRQMAGNETICSDYSGVVDGFAKGRQWGLRPECFHGGIWKLLWEIVDSGNEVHIIKVKAH